MNWNDDKKRNILQQNYLEKAYEDKLGDTVNWVGIKLKDTKEFNTFLGTRVFNRVVDLKGEKECTEFLSGLSIAHMGNENLTSHLSSRVQEVKTSVGCEALAEAYLEDQEGVVFPWNAKRDLRNPNASLSGADIVGIVGEDSESIFAFGECKKSWQKKISAECYD